MSAMFRPPEPTWVSEMAETWRRTTALFTFLILVAANTAPAEDQVPGLPVSRAALHLALGTSHVVSLPAPAIRASLADPEIADSLVLSPRSLYVLGKKVGVTTLTVWSHEDTVSALYDIVIEPNLDQLDRTLRRLFPDEQGFRVGTAGDHLVLLGRVSNAAVLASIVAVAEAHAPKRLLNLLNVGGVQQVMLEVRVAEIDRALLRRLGVNGSFTDGSGKGFGVSVLKNLTSVLPSGDSSAAISPGPLNGSPPPFGIGLGSAITALFRGGIGNATWTMFLDALKEQNLVKVLAEPTLVALNGQEASVLAGGEFPIPIPQAFGVTTVQYKSFGVQLKFRPVILNDRQVSVTVTPEVSELDFANSLTLQGFTVPSVTTRRASTVVELAPGDSFVIAGLLRDTVRETVSKFPFLGDLPVLGALFRSTKFEKNESELIILVTPRLATPVPQGTISLPTDRYREPSDLELYLLGRTGTNLNSGLPSASQGTSGKEE